MGMGELDGDGNVNSTKMGPRCAGAGGFVDITQNAKTVVFLGTFTAKGAKYSFEDGKLTILQEGAIKKIDGVNDATVSFLTQKLTLDAEDARFEAVLDEVVRVCKKVEPDCQIVR